MQTKCGIAGVCISLFEGPSWEYERELTFWGSAVTDAGFWFPGINL